MTSSRNRAPARFPLLLVTALAPELASGCSGAASGPATSAGSATPPVSATMTPPATPTGSATAKAPVGPAARDPLARLGHIVVIYMENHSFDNLYGEFPGAEGVRSPGAAKAGVQLDASGKPYAALPQPVDNTVRPVRADARFPKSLPNGPFLIDTYLKPDVPSASPTHRFYQQQEQINGGAMNRFVAVSEVKSFVMGYYRTSALPLSKVAGEFTLCDHFFHAAFGGSFLNHIWLVAAASPTFPNAPAEMVATVDAKGALSRDPATGEVVKDGAVTPDGFAVNTAQPFYPPYRANTPENKRVPPQKMPTIGDRLSEAGVDWAWYSGGWNEAEAGRIPEDFATHHQAFNFFERYAPGTAARKAHLKDEKDFFSAARAGKLPAVSFVKPGDKESEHPGEGDIITGDNHVIEMIDAIRKSPTWGDTAIIIAYDENGGFWDHVAPPVVDRWGPGARVPAMVVSPFARKGYVDSTVYDTTSILALIEHRFGLAPLTGRDARANDMRASFDFGASP
jgi:acid phosphatase